MVYPATACSNSRMIVKDHWRITTAAIQLEMERIAGLIEKSARFQSRACSTSRRDVGPQESTSEHPAEIAARR
jgi:hypothetical protein